MLNSDFNFADIPGSDSPEPDERIQLPPPPSVNQSGKNSYVASVPYDDADDSRSQASTAIEDSQSGASDSECDANDGLGMETDDACDSGITGK